MTAAAVPIPQRRRISRARIFGLVAWSFVFFGPVLLSLAVICYAAHALSPLVMP